jgi:hypothetical protein
MFFVYRPSRNGLGIKLVESIDLDAGEMQHIGRTVTWNIHI